MQQRLKFYNVGPNQTAGVVAMHIDGERYRDAKYKSVTVLFNVDKVARQVPIAELRGKKLSVHKIQRQLTDSLAVLESMSPKDYQEIRARLGNGSGQESPGHRALLRMAGPLAKPDRASPAATA